MTKRELALKIAWSYLGTPYRWGGDDFSSFDCSGFVIECLKSVGSLPRQGDWTADGLSKKWPAIPVAQPGDLVFWWNSNKTRVIHVEMVFTPPELSIGASGGGSKVKTEADAIVFNAFVKIRPIHSRKGVWGYVDPYSH